MSDPKIIPFPKKMQDAQTKDTVYTFKLELDGSHPSIWRTLEIPGVASLGYLHQVLQTVMKWSDCHLHQFCIGKKYYSAPSLKIQEDDPDVLDEFKYHLNDFKLQKGDVIHYEYDFGDSWEHTLAVTDISEKSLDHAVCLDGERASPPEDSGGIGGYEDLLETLSDPENEDYPEMMEWVGKEFDPKRFDLGLINKKLKKLTRLKPSNEEPEDIQSFDPVHLKKLLDKTGFSCRPVPFIHGVLTLIEISPLFSKEVDEFLEEEAGKCSLIFNFKEEELPDLGIKDKRIHSVLDYLDIVSEQLLHSLKDETFEPYFGEHSPETPGLSVAKEWCEGFTAALQYKIERWLKEGRIDEKTIKTFYEATAFIFYCASPIEAGKQPDKSKKIKQIFKDPQKVISYSVFDLRDLFSDYEAALSEPPLPMKTEPKTGRNDLCPCGSGKKFKKCCGK